MTILFEKKNALLPVTNSFFLKHTKKWHCFVEILNNRMWLHEIYIIVLHEIQVLKKPAKKIDCFCLTHCIFLMRPIFLRAIQVSRSCKNKNVLAHCIHRCDSLNWQCDDFYYACTYLWLWLMPIWYRLNCALCKNCKWCFAQCLVCFFLFFFLFCVRVLLMHFVDCMIFVVCVYKLCASDLRTAWFVSDIYIFWLHECVSCFHSLKAQLMTIPHSETTG